MRLSMALLFLNDDPGYLEWLDAHPSGFVVNLRRVPSRSYAVLHRASCAQISRKPDSAGAYTERGYSKLCAETAADARDGLARILHGPHVDFSKRCAICDPA
jgi:hypothetical protein